MNTHACLASSIVVGLAASAANANIITNNINDAQMNALIDTELMVAEGRIGNNALSGTHELALGPDTGNAGTLATEQFVWSSGQAYSWTFSVSGGMATFTLDNEVLMNSMAGDFTDLFLRTRSTDGSSSLLDNLVLNGQSIGANSFSAGSSPADVLHISNFSTDNFMLSGTAVFEFGTPAPSNSALAFQIKAATTLVPAPGALALLGLAGCVGARRRRRRN